MCDWGFWWWLFPFLGLGMMVLCFGMMFLRWLFGWPRYRADWRWPEPFRSRYRGGRHWSEPFQPEPPEDEVAELREEIKALRREISSWQEHQKERPS